MYKLTDRRLVTIKPILEKHRKEFLAVGSIATGIFESDLRESLDTGYREIKSLVVALSRNARYRLIAAYYMQHNGGVGPIGEFKQPLAELYGTKQYDPKDADGKRKAFWARALKKRSKKTAAM